MPERENCTSFLDAFREKQKLATKHLVGCERSTGFDGLSPTAREDGGTEPTVLRESSLTPPPLKKAKAELQLIFRDLTDDLATTLWKQGYHGTFDVSATAYSSLDSGIPFSPLEFESLSALLPPSLTPVALNPRTPEPSSTRVDKDDTSSFMGTGSDLVSPKDKGTPFFDASTPTAPPSDYLLSGYKLSHLLGIGTQTQRESLKHLLPNDPVPSSRRQHTEGDVESPSYSRKRDTSAFRKSIHQDKTAVGNSATPPSLSHSIGNRSRGASLTASQRSTLQIPRSIGKRIPHVHLMCSPDRRSSHGGRSACDIYIKQQNDGQGDTATAMGSLEPSPVVSSHGSSCGSLQESSRCCSPSFSPASSLLVVDCKGTTATRVSGQDYDKEGLAALGDTLLSFPDPVDPIPVGAASKGNDDFRDVEDWVLPVSPLSCFLNCSVRDGVEKCVGSSAQLPSTRHAEDESCCYANNRPPAPIDGGAASSSSSSSLWPLSHTPSSVSSVVCSESRHLMNSSSCSFSSSASGCASAEPRAVRRSIESSALLLDQDNSALATAPVSLFSSTNVVNCAVPPQPQRESKPAILFDKKRTPLANISAASEPVPPAPAPTSEALSEETFLSAKSYCSLSTVLPKTLPVPPPSLPSSRVLRGDPSHHHSTCSSTRVAKQCDATQSLTAGSSSPAEEDTRTHIKAPVKLGSCGRRRSRAGTGESETDGMKKGSSHHYQQQHHHQNPIMMVLSRTTRQSPARQDGQRPCLLCSHQPAGGVFHSTCNTERRPPKLRPIPPPSSPPPLPPPSFPCGSSTTSSPPSGCCRTGSSTATVEHAPLHEGVKEMTPCHDASLLLRRHPLSGELRSPRKAGCHKILTYKSERRGARAASAAFLTQRCCLSCPMVSSSPVSSCSIGTVPGYPLLLSSPRDSTINSPTAGAECCWRRRRPTDLSLDPVAEPNAASDGDGVNPTAPMIETESRTVRADSTLQRYTASKQRLGLPGTLFESSERSNSNGAPLLSPSSSAISEALHNHKRRLMEEFKGLQERTESQQQAFRLLQKSFNTAPRVMLPAVTTANSYPSEDRRAGSTTAGLLFPLVTPSVPPTSAAVTSNNTSRDNQRHTFSSAINQSSSPYSDRPVPSDARFCCVSSAVDTPRPDGSHRLQPEPVLLTQETPGVVLTTGPNNRRQHSFAPTTTTTRYKRHRHHGCVSVESIALATARNHPPSSPSQPVSASPLASSSSSFVRCCREKQEEAKESELHTVCSCHRTNMGNNSGTTGGASVATNDTERFQSSRPMSMGTSMPATLVCATAREERLNPHHLDRGRARNDISERVPVLEEDIGHQGANLAATVLPTGRRKTPACISSCRVDSPPLPTDRDAQMRSPSSLLRTNGWATHRHHSDRNTPKGLPPPSPSVLSPDEKKNKTRLALLTERRESPPIWRHCREPQRLAHPPSPSLQSASPLTLRLPANTARRYGTPSGSRPSIQSPGPTRGTIASPATDITYGSSIDTHKSSAHVRTFRDATSATLVSSVPKRLSDTQLQRLGTTFLEPTSTRQPFPSPSRTLATSASSGTLPARLSPQNLSNQVVAGGGSNVDGLRPPPCGKISTATTPRRSTGSFALSSSTSSKCVITPRAPVKLTPACKGNRLTPPRRNQVPTPSSSEKGFSSRVSTLPRFLCNSPPVPGSSNTVEGRSSSSRTLVLSTAARKKTTSSRPQTHQSHHYHHTHHMVCPSSDYSACLSARTKRPSGSSASLKGT